MQKIKKMVKQIKSELHDAEKYAKCALEYKDLDEELAALYYRLACEEMEHMDLLHGRIVATIADYRRKSGEPPAAMRAVWEYEHAEMMEEAAEIKAKIARYKE